MQPRIDKVQEFEPPKIAKHRKAKQETDESCIDSDTELIALRKRVSEIENLHPELTPPKPTPLYFIIIKWLFFLIIVGLFIYAIYMFYLYDKLGKDIIIPFWGILRH